MEEWSWKGKGVGYNLIKKLKIRHGKLKEKEECPFRKGNNNQRKGSRDKSSVFLIVEVCSHQSMAVLNYNKRKKIHRKPYVQIFKHISSIEY